LFLVPSLTEEIVARLASRIKPEFCHNRERLIELVNNERSTGCRAVAPLATLRATVDRLRKGQPHAPWEKPRGAGPSVRVAFVEKGKRQSQLAAGTATIRFATTYRFSSFALIHRDSSTDIGITTHRQHAFVLIGFTFELSADAQFSQVWVIHCAASKTRPAPYCPGGTQEVFVIVLGGLGTRARFSGRERYAPSYSIHRLGQMNLLSS
jgi:hypothetical protein